MANEPRVGKLIQGPACRDAIHVAIVPLVAGEILRRGYCVKLAQDSQEIVVYTGFDDEEALGVVDPFLDRTLVQIGERFWCFLIPGTVTGMRHHWSHPAFDQEATSVHERWLKEFCNRCHFDYQEVIKEAMSGSREICIEADGVDIHSSGELVCGEEELFWEHLEGLTGKTFDASMRDQTVWSCNC